MALSLIMLSTLKSLHKITRYYHAIEIRGCILRSYKREMWFVYDFFSRLLFHFDFLIEILYRKFVNGFSHA